MKDWLLTAGLAIAALAAFYALFVNSGSQEPPVSRPLSSESGPNGYLGLVRWLRTQQIEPVVLRDRFTRLASVAGSAATGNLLISTAPHVYPLRNAEVAPLLRWIEAGNTLLLVAGLSDTPEWAAAVETDVKLTDSLQQMTGLRFTIVPADEAADAPKRRGPVPAPNQRLPRPQRFELVPTEGPTEAHPLLAGVTRVQAVSEYPTGRWRAELDATRLALELASSPQADVPVLWLARAGRGQIIISAFGSVFTNKLLGKDDNAELLANIVQWSLAAPGRVIIDDAHQGSVAFYDPQAFFGDARLHRTLWVLLALWLVFVLGPQRLRVAASGSRPADLTAFVRATGGFMARVLEPASAARQMFSLFFTEVHRRTGLSVQDTPPWDWLTAHAGIDPADLARLRQLHADAEQNRRVNLQQLHNLLARARGSWLRH